MLNFIVQNATAIIGILGALAFMVAIMVELTKELPYINKIPTKLWTIILSMIVCISVVVMYFAARSILLHWYYIALAFFGAFIVAYLAMYGWESAKELWNRYTEKK